MTMPQANTAMVQDDQTSRLHLVDPADSRGEVAAAFDLLPAINVFRAMANAETLFPPFMAYLALLFRQLELDAATERMIVLRVARRSDCFYAWRQNVVVARSVGVTEEQIAALDRSDATANCFTAAQRAAFAFCDEAMDLIEVTDRTYAAARRHFSDRALTEILYVIGTYMLVARIIRTGHVPLDAEPAASPSSGDDSALQETRRRDEGAERS
jgi:alkylhydroperoxidase family enzyme